MGTVTAVIPEWFRLELARMAGLKYAPSNLATHWDGLWDVDPATLQGAVTVAIRECTAFPSPAEVREIVARTSPAIGPDEDLSVQVAEPMTVHFSLAGRDLPVTREWRHYCTRCEDTGWAPSECGVNGQVTCGREFQHSPHVYVALCSCCDSNPTVTKRRQRIAQQAAHRTAKQGHA